jgi:hypothetical protein
VDLSSREVHVKFCLYLPPRQVKILWKNWFDRPGTHRSGGGGGCWHTCKDWFVHDHCLPPHGRINLSTFPGWSREPSVNSTSISWSGRHGIQVALCLSAFGYSDRTYSMKVTPTPWTWPSPRCDSMSTLQKSIIQLYRIELNNPPTLVFVSHHTLTHRHLFTSSPLSLVLNTNEQSSDR